jgi:hypothetical protein
MTTFVKVNRTPLAVLIILRKKNRTEEKKLVRGMQIQSYVIILTKYFFLVIIAKSFSVKRHRDEIVYKGIIL